MSADRERILWVNVILQAIRDATEATNTHTPAYERTQARHWFRLSNPDFIEACHCAHLDPEATYEKALKAIATYDAMIANGERYRIADPNPAQAKAKRTAKLYTFRGERHTVTEWAVILGVPRPTLMTRLHAGYSVDEAFAKPFVPRRSAFARKANTPKAPKLHTINGVTKSLTEWAIDAKLDFKTLTYRMRKGMALEAALALKPRARAKTHTVNGITKTLEEWADHLGITYSALIGRMRNGRSLAEAIAMTAGRHADRGVVSNLRASEGTGAGSAAQDRPEIDFSQDAQ